MASPARAVAALWKRGELNYKLRPEQQAIKALLDKSGRELVVPNVARKIGKTTTCVTWACEQGRKRKMHIRYATAFLSDLTEFLLPIIDMVIADCPEHLRPVYNQSKKTYTFPGTGSVIKLVGLDKNKNGLRGNIIDILIIDEAAFVSNLGYLYRSVIIPATKNRPFKLVFPSTPPESPEHFWASELVQKAKERGTYLEMTLDADESLAPEERKRLLDEVGGEDSPTAQREYFCKIIVDVTRAVCASFKPELHVRPVVAENVKWWLFGDTGGVRDKTVFLEVGYDHATQLVMFRSEYAVDRNTPTTNIIAGVKAKWPGNTNIVLDASGQLLIDYSSAGLPATLPAKDEFSAGLLLLLTTFHNNRAIIDPACSLLIRTLQGGLLNKQRTDYERTESLGHCDAVAAAIYGIRGADKVTDLRPKPKTENIFFIPKEPDHIKQLKGLTYRG
jgi:hypothetical protein